MNKRGGVLLGDVVGLGKTLRATAIARIFEDEYGMETLIICPKNLENMWKDYRERFHSSYYGFTDEELDFIINYDIKYRMGQESLEDVEE